MLLLTRALLLSILCLTAGCDTTGVDTPANIVATGTPWSEMIDAVNELRAEGKDCGSTYMPPTGPVVWNANLTEAAESHALDMSARQFFSHEGSDGSHVGDRARRAGYEWRVIGENIARYQSDVDQVMTDWIQSEGHCLQLMDPRFVELGAFEKDRYWVQVFGVSG